MSVLVTDLWRICKGWLQNKKPTAPQELYFNLPNNGGLLKSRVEPIERRGPGLSSPTLQSDSRIQPFKECPPGAADEVFPS